MYGIVNRAIEELVIQNYGENKWNEIKTKSKISEDFFISNQSYDDSVSYLLIQTSEEVLDIPSKDILIMLGEHWILKTGLTHYKNYMISGGNNIKDFLINLPNFHTRVQLIFPKLRPPEFEITNIKDNSLQLHYYSNRNGLQHFVYGLIKGIAKMFEKQIEIIIEKSREQGDSHEVFFIKWF